MQSALITRLHAASRQLIAASLLSAVCATIAIAQTASLAVASAQPARKVGEIRGTVFDSLVYRPVPKALVWVPGTQSTTVADENGEFSLSDVPAGAHFIAFSAPALDSLGLGTLGHSVAVSEGDTSRVLVASPSFATVWRALCGRSEKMSGDSGIVWGTIRDATTDRRLSNAPAAFSWNEVSIHFRQLHTKTQMHRVRADSTGTYYACGLPPYLSITSEAAGTSMASGTVQYMIGAHRILRVDMLVSPEMVMTIPTGKTKVDVDSLSGVRPHGTSTVRGTVRDETGRALANVSVSFPSADSSVTTNAQGQFTFGALPAGTHALETRQVGFTPASVIVDLHPGTITEVSVSMPKVNELTAVNVRDKLVRADHAAFLERRQLGFGIAREAKDFAKRQDVADIFQDLPDLYVDWGVHGATIHVGSRAGNCVPAVFINGNHMDMEALMLYKVKDIVAYEYFEDKRQLPLVLQPFPGCGALLIWTHKARW